MAGAVVIVKVSILAFLENHAETKTDGHQNKYRYININTEENMNQHNRGKTAAYKNKETQANCFNEYMALQIGNLQRRLNMNLSINTFICVFPKELVLSRHNFYNA